MEVLVGFIVGLLAGGFIGLLVGGLDRCAAERDDEDGTRG